MRNYKNQIRQRKLSVPSQAGSDLFDAVVGNATDLFVEHTLPWMGKNTVGMGRYKGSGALRNKNPQRKANYGINKLTSFMKNVGSQALDQQERS